MDLRADEPFSLAPGERRLVPTGLALEIPPGHEGQARPRSGLAVRHGIALVNAPGTVDSDRHDLDLANYRAAEMWYRLELEIAALKSDQRAKVRIMQLLQLETSR